MRFSAEEAIVFEAIAALSVSPEIVLAAAESVGAADSAYKVNVYVLSPDPCEQGAW